MAVAAICIAVAVILIVILSLTEKRSEKCINNTEAIDYNSYSLTGTERAKYTVMAAAVLFGVGYVFFDDIVLSILLSGLSFFYPSIKRRDLIKKRKTQLNTQFKDMLYSVSSSLSAGRSVEGAIRSSLGDLSISYPDEDTYIIRELVHINRRIEMNETIESALLDFAGRADIEDINNFVDVFVICKRTGGNLVEVIKNAANIINQKIEIKNEIEVQVAEQKLSQKVLNIMPFGLLVLISASSPEYIEPLYTPVGNIVMFVVLALLVIAYVIGTKIMDIRV